MAYRITPHASTGARWRTVLPLMQVPCLKRESQINVDVAVKDALLKAKGKIYDAPKRQAADRQANRDRRAKNKLSPIMFEDALYKVKNKDGNEVTVESEDGVQYIGEIQPMLKYMKQKSV